MKRINRRHFLGGLGATVSLLPWVSCGGRSENGDSPFASSRQPLNTSGKLRFIVFCGGNGTIVEQAAIGSTATNPTYGANRPSSIAYDGFRPEMLAGVARSDQTLALSQVGFSPLMSPLQPYMQYLTQLDGVSMLSAVGAGANAHVVSRSHQLVGDTELDHAGGGADAGNISVDQLIATQFGDVTQKRSLHIGINASSEISYAAAGLPSARFGDPYSAYSPTWEFSGLTTNAALLYLKSQHDALLNDVLNKDFGALNPRLDTAAQARLQQHISQLSDIKGRETQVAGPVANGCADPNLGSKPTGFTAGANLQTRYQQTIDMLISTLACDITRVATLMVGDVDVDSGTEMQSPAALATSSPVPVPAQATGDGIDPAARSAPWIFQHDYHTYWTHNEPNNPQWLRNLGVAQMNKLRNQMFAYLMSKLTTVKDADGNLLMDNTIVLYTNEFSTGQHHYVSQDSIPYLVAAGSRFGFPGGKYIQYAQMQPHNNLLVSILNALGITQWTDPLRKKTTSLFGNPMFCTGPLKNFG